MSSKTKIVVLHMKEIIYTVLFVILGILLLILLAVMFFPKDKETSAGTANYTPGVYTSSVTLNNMELLLEVTVDESHINSIRCSNLDETVTTMYPFYRRSKTSPIKFVKHSRWKTSPMPRKILTHRKSS